MFNLWQYLSINEDNSSSDIGRNTKRFDSHNLVEVSLSKWNFLNTESAVLLDISETGCKIEFVSNIKPLKKGDVIILSILLSPFNIFAPNKLKLKFMIKWFDTKTLRSGGIFISVEKEQIIILDQIINKVINKGI